MTFCTTPKAAWPSACRQPTSRARRRTIARFASAFPSTTIGPK
jgi:hypothetical protein